MLNVCPMCCYCNVCVKDSETYIYMLHNFYLFFFLAQLRKIPEIDDMMVFCKKCLENLKEIRELAKADDHSWMNEAS